jgi:hypothetical protein
MEINSTSFLPVGRIRYPRNQHPEEDLSPTSIALMKIADWDGTPEDIGQVLTAAFEAEDYLDCINNLWAEGVDPASYINGLDKVRTRPIPR